MSKPQILVLAGGASSRMAPLDKLLIEVAGIPLLRRCVLRCLEVGAVSVVIPPDRPERARALNGLACNLIVNEGSDLGMSHSLKVGVEQITDSDVLIVLPDLPELTSADMRAILTAAETSDAVIVRGQDQSGQAGHPVLIRAALLEELSKIEGDQGARPLLERYRDQTTFVMLPDQHATLDIDTPDALARWREMKR